MKIWTRNISYEKFAEIKPREHKKPRKQLWLFRPLLKLVTDIMLWPTGMKYNKTGMEKLKKDEPCLVLMNHSAFEDLEIVANLMHKRPYHIVCTLDSYVGILGPVLRLLGCIVTRKFVTELDLVKDMLYTVNTLKESVVMFPEAGYSFDGTHTTLPESLGKCVKLMKVPVVMVHTYGAFSRVPLYNGLQIRKVKLSADVEYVLSPKDIREKSADELQKIIEKKFAYDHFKWQQDNQICISESFRADHLNRVLYQCPHCLTEGRMEGKGITLTCHHCGKQYELTEYGYLQATEGETRFDHIPDWYRWQRSQVRRQLEEGSYLLDTEVDIYALKNPTFLYRIGEGRLCHDKEGFHLTGCDGKLDYRQSPMASYSLNSDFYWYEIGDMISIGDAKCLYYCFPKHDKDVAAKARLAAEELYKMTKQPRFVDRSKGKAL